MATLKVKRHSEDARLPTRATAGSVGYDIYAAYGGIVPAKGNFLVATELSVSCPDGYYARLASRSGLASKHGIEVGAGTIDPAPWKKIFVLYLEIF